MQDMVATRFDAEQLLKRRGVQPTPQRTEILHLLYTAQRHMAADEIHALLTTEHAKASRATVYNTLSLLVSHGLLREVVAEPGRVLYDPNTAPHHHFYDVESGELWDVAEDHVGFVCLPKLPPNSRFEGLDVIIKIRRAEEASA